MKPRRMVPALVVAALVGCSLIHPRRPDDATQRVGSAGQTITAKRCALKVAILSRPLKDPALNEVLWRVADEQAVPAEVRHALEANGLRIGLAVGDLPAEVQALLDAPPPHRVDPKTIVLPDGDSTLVALGPAVPQASLLLNRPGGGAAGHDYKDARGTLRLTASHDGQAGVALRIVPEVHHGEFRHRIGADANPGAFAPQQFVFKDGQDEETFRDLAATLTVKPGQLAVIGSLPERRHSVGDFLLTEPEAGSDRLLQKVVLVWATPNAEVPAAGPAPPPPDLRPVDPPEEPRAPAGPQAKPPG